MKKSLQFLLVLLVLQTVIILTMKQFLEFDLTSAFILFYGCAIFVFLVNLKKLKAENKE